jgi:hypothetical protein
MAKKKKYIKYYGEILRPQVPMIMTYDEDHVKYIASHLGEAIERAYQIFDLFDDKDDDFDPFE